jgi:hypothetical protein
MPKPTNKDRAPKKTASKARPKKASSATKKLKEAVGAPPSPPAEDSAKRQLSPRGTAPWVSRHAAKHKAEHLARVAAPAPPGSARSTLREPADAGELKAKVAELYSLMARIKTLLKRPDRSFFEIGEIFLEIQARELHLAKGYASFEAFVERERELGGRALASRMMKIAQTFQKEAALDYGLDRLSSALLALDGELGAPKPAPSNSPPLPLKPPIRVVG